MDSHRGRVEWRRRSDSPAHGGRQHSCDGERHEQASSALQAADGANAANIAIAIAYAAAAVAADDRDAVGRRFRCGASLREALERRAQSAGDDQECGRLEAAECSSERGCFTRGGVPCKRKLKAEVPAMHPGTIEYALWEPRCAG